MLFNKPNIDNANIRYRKNFPIVIHIIDGITDSLKAPPNKTIISPMNGAHAKTIE